MVDLFVIYQKILLLFFFLCDHSTNKKGTNFVVIVWLIETKTHSHENVYMHESLEANRRMEYVMLSW